MQDLRGAKHVGFWLKMGLRREIICPFHQISNILVRFASKSHVTEIHGHRQSHGTPFIELILPQNATATLSNMHDKLSIIDFIVRMTYHHNSYMMLPPHSSKGYYQSGCSQISLRSFPDTVTGNHLFAKHLVWRVTRNCTKCMAESPIGAWISR